MNQKLLIDSESNAGVLKYEITAEDLMKVVMDIIRETTKSILTKYDEERSPDFIPRKEAVEKFKLKIPLMSRPPHPVQAPSPCASPPTLCRPPHPVQAPSTLCRPPHYVQAPSLCAGEKKRSTRVLPG